MEKVAAVVVASGYGAFRKDETGQCIPKVVETVDGMPMVCHSIVKAIAAGFSPCIVVVNSLFEMQIRRAIPLAFMPVSFVVQPDRFGPGDAVYRAAKIADSRSLLMIYADMPFWSVSTFRSLATRHLRSSAHLTMATVPLSLSGLPEEIRRYGRIVRARNGEILRVVEPKESDGSPEVENATHVNPSLMAFESRWFCGHVFRTPPFSKGDEYPPEVRIPPLVEWASRTGARISELQIEDPYEPYGVNNEEELEKTRKIFVDRDK